MSAGRILTLGLGTPFSAVKYLVTLGLKSTGAGAINVPQTLFITSEVTNTSVTNFSVKYVELF